jgi:hypothetical protein
MTGPMPPGRTTVSGRSGTKAGGCPLNTSATVCGQNRGIQSLRRKAAGTSRPPPGRILPMIGEIKRSWKVRPC